MIAIFFMMLNLSIVMYSALVFSKALSVHMLILGILISLSRSSPSFNVLLKRSS